MFDWKKQLDDIFERKEQQKAREREKEQENERRIQAQQIEKQRELDAKMNAHKVRFKCAVCGRSSSGPVTEKRKVGKHVEYRYDGYVPDTPDPERVINMSPTAKYVDDYETVYFWDKPNDLEQCTKCSKWLCQLDTHKCYVCGKNFCENDYYRGYCQKCASKIR